MRNLRLSLAGLVTLATIGTVSLSQSAIAHASSLPTLASCKTSINADEFAKGKLTVATDTPAYTPWFANNTPSNGKGYESGVAYAIAKELGVKKSNVVWVHEPFNASFEPGNKKFDFDINEISYTASRAQVVTFSNSYYDVQQSIIALKGSKIAKDHTPAELKTYQYGDQVGTTGLALHRSEDQAHQVAARVQLPGRRGLGPGDGPDRRHHPGHAGRSVHGLARDRAKVINAKKQDHRRPGRTVPEHR